MYNNYYGVFAYRLLIFIMCFVIMFTILAYFLYSMLLVGGYYGVI